jgi:hypothetical protein
VSSCNKEEVPLALARLRHEGAIVTTSESFMYECCGDAGTPEYVLIFATTIAETGLMPYTRRSSLTDSTQVQADYQDRQRQLAEHQGCAPKIV